MHQFQPYPIEVIEFNPFLKIDKEWAVLSAKGKDKISGMTVSWGSFGTFWGKSVANVYVRESRYTKELIDHSSRFSLSFLKEDSRPLLNYLGSASGRDEDKFKQAGLNLDNHMGIPYIDEAEFVILCRKMAAVPIPESTFLDPTIKSQFYEDDDFHTMYIGEVMALLAR